MFDEICSTCRGRGRVTIRDEDENLITVICDQCDGTGATEEYESFQRYRKKGQPRRFDDD